MKTDVSPTKLSTHALISKTKQYQVHISVIMINIKSSQSNQIFIVSNPFIVCAQDNGHFLSYKTHYATIGFDFLEMDLLEIHINSL